MWWKAEPVYQLAMRPKTLNLTAQRMFADSCKCSSVNRMAAGSRLLVQVMDVFLLSPTFLPGGQDVFFLHFQVSISIGIFVSNSLSRSTTDGTKWTSFCFGRGSLLTAWLIRFSPMS